MIAPHISSGQDFVQDYRCITHPPRKAIPGSFRYQANWRRQLSPKYVQVCSLGDPALHANRVQLGIFLAHQLGEGIEDQGITFGCHVDSIAKRRQPSLKRPLMLVL